MAIKEIPEGLNIVMLEVLLMPNGELLCNGKSVGWFSDFQKYLFLKEDIKNAL